jgi:hypothetical protein
MEKKTYLTQEELDKFLTYLKKIKKWKYYLIVYNLVLLKKTYKEMKKMDIIIPEGIPDPNCNPFLMNIRSVNKALKIFQAQCGIRDIPFTTKLFSRRFLMDGKIYYGTFKEKKLSYSKEEYGFIYIVKHTHRNPEVSKLLTDKKIGISFDYRKRIQQLTLGTVGIEVVKMWKSNNSLIMKLEKDIHSKLKERNLIGEWFSDEDDQLVGIVSNIILSYTPSEC